MSTRCQIVTYERDGKLHPVKIYKHCDGYPSGVMDVLEPFAKAFAADRGVDPDYLLAQIVRQFAIRDAREADERKAEVGNDAAKLKYLYDPTTSFTGWGLDLDWHGDIEYVYAVSPDGTSLGSGWCYCAMATRWISTTCGASLPRLTAAPLACLGAPGRCAPSRGGA